MNSSTNNFVDYGRQIAAGVRHLKYFRLSYIRKVFSFMGKNEKIAIFALTAIALLTFAWSARNLYVRATVPIPALGGTYTEGTLGQPMHINPLYAYQPVDLALSKLVFSGLYTYDSNGEIAPDVADGMPAISEDQKEYVVHLKKNARWHNDTPVTADDVVFTIQAIQDPNFKSPYRGMWMATTVEKLDDYSVRFTTKDVSGPFIHNLTLPLVSKSIWSGMEASSAPVSGINLEAIGNGPYAVSDIKKLTSGKVKQITLRSNAAYHGQPPFIEYLTFKFYDQDEELVNALHTKEIHGFGFIPLESTLYLENNRERTQLFKIPLPHYEVAFFNLKNKILAELPVRKALQLATDKQALIDQVYRGNALAPSGSNPDLAQATRLLEDAGWKMHAETGIRTKKNIPLELTIATNDSPLNTKAAEVLAEQWKTLNIKISLTILPTKQLNETYIKPRAFDILLFPQKLGADPDPFVFWHSSQTHDPGLNLTGFENTAADKLITEARTTTNQFLRKQKYAEFSKLLADQIPALFLSQAQYVYALDADIRNITYNSLYDASNRFYDVSSWYMETARDWK